MINGIWKICQSVMSATHMSVPREVAVSIITTDISTVFSRTILTQTKWRHHMSYNEFLWMEAVGKMCGSYSGRMI